MKLFRNSKKAALHWYLKISLHSQECEGAKSEKIEVWLDYYLRAYFVSSDDSRIFTLYSYKLKGLRMVAILN